MEIRGYVANLGRYNEGQLIGEWVTFPVDEDEWSEVLQRIGISDEPDENGRIYEEFFFADWDCGCDFDFGEYEDLDFVEESGMLAGVDDTIARYFDYEAYGRDLEIEGTFLPTESGYIEVIR